MLAGAQNAMTIDQLRELPLFDLWRLSTQINWAILERTYFAPAIIAFASILIGAWARWAEAKRVDGLLRAISDIQGQTKDSAK